MDVDLPSDLTVYVTVGPRALRYQMDTLCQRFIL